METGDVLVIGNSGVGKSTLINAVLGIEKAKTGYGISGTTNELEIYESDSVPFRVIDTIGFEPTFFKEQKAINAVKKSFACHVHLEKCACDCCDYKIVFGS
jgi:ribosome biogenesis GTPase A